jgi:Spermine/spermidine synthase domain
MTNETQGNQIPDSPGDGAGANRSHRAGQAEPASPDHASGPTHASGPAQTSGPVDGSRQELEQADGSAQTTGPAQATASPGGATKVRLFGLSFLMLFVELALIRWTGANVLYLSYFSNFVLLGSFLGIGLGFLRARSRVNLFPWAPVALALLILFVLVFPVQVNRAGTRLLFFTSTPLKTTGLPTWVTLPVIFLAVAAVMMMLGEGVARTFVLFRPLEAYRLDILGSIAGIAVFSALSFANAKPIAWGLVVAVVLAALYGRRIGIVQVAGLVALVAMLGAETFSSSDLWSPYYRISVTRHGHNYVVSANGVPHQVIQPQRYRSKFYFLPYRQAVGNPLSDVLIIGAGTGNDVATALGEGAKHVDAVEIDPEIYQLGKRLNPNHPYQNPRVSAYINDGRAFLEQTNAKYNMILFALPDSLTLVAGQSQLRLESYLFTLQAIQDAKAHLNPTNGVFAMYNYYRTTWLRNRLADTLDVVFGHPPCARTTFGDLSMLTVSVNPAVLHCRSLWQRPKSVVAPATDDHPFVYLESAAIPGYYLLTLLMILLASIVAVRVVSGPVRRMSGFVDLFWMGAAFMLLETKSIVQFALLFGTTWFVNALVFAGVLAAVYAAVEVSRRVVIRRPAPLYLALLAALVVAWAVPDAQLLSLPAVPRFAAAVALAFAPIFLANVVFAQRFRDTADSTVAFGANLLGAMVGGLIEYTSLITGYRWLLAVVAAAYGLAFVTGYGRAQFRSVTPYAGTGSRPVGRTIP